MRIAFEYAIGRQMKQEPIKIMGRLTLLTSSAEEESDEGQRRTTLKRTVAVYGDND